MEFNLIEAFAAKQGDDFIEIIFKNGRTMTGKRLRKSVLWMDGNVNIWEIDDEGQFPVQFNGSDIERMCFVN